MERSSANYSYGMPNALTEDKESKRELESRRGETFDDEERRGRRRRRPCSRPC